jgi:hypothetical protein
MAGTGNWFLHGFDIGLPLEVDYGISADISGVRINGAKTQSIANSVEPTNFKVQFLKEFANETEQKEFRQQIEQLQNGIKFMPYELETNEFSEELNDTLVNIKSVDMPKEAGKVNWIKYEIEFALLGHKSEFIGYTQYRPVEVIGTWTSWNSWRKVDISYPVGAIFHSDSPTGTLNGEFGGMDYRVSPSRNAISYYGAVGKERVGIVAKQGNIQLFSPHFQIGVGFEITNGYFKFKIDQNGEPQYERWNGSAYQSYSLHPPRFRWACFDYDTDGTTVINHKLYYSEQAVFTKLQLKKLTTEYAEIELEYQHSDGTITAIQWFMNRGKNSLQIRARCNNRHLDYFYAYSSVDRTYVTDYTLNGTTTPLADTTNVSELLNVDPAFYLTVGSAVGGGYFGFINPDKNIVTGIVKVNTVEGFVEIGTRHSYNEKPNVWSEPLMYYQGTTYPPAKRDQAGYLIKADSQVVHRSHVY